MCTKKIYKELSSQLHILLNKEENFFKPNEHISKQKWSFLKPIAYISNKNEATKACSYIQLSTIALPICNYAQGLELSTSDELQPHDTCQPCTGCRTQ